MHKIDVLNLLNLELRILVHLARPVVLGRDHLEELDQLDAVAKVGLNVLNQRVFATLAQMAVHPFGESLLPREKKKKKKKKKKIQEKKKKKKKKKKSKKVVETATIDRAPHTTAPTTQLTFCCTRSHARSMISLPSLSGVALPIADIFQVFFETALQKMQIKTTKKKK
jgi:hypothetical protein